MKTRAWRKSMPDGDVVDELGDLVRAEEAGLDLAGDRLRKRGHRTLTKPKKRLVAYSVRDMAMHRVVVKPLGSLCLLQVVANVSEEFIIFCQRSGDSGHPCLT
jgi:hypothetical protein